MEIYELKLSDINSYKDVEAVTSLTFGYIDTFGTSFINAVITEDFNAWSAKCTDVVTDAIARCVR